MAQRRTKKTKAPSAATQQMQFNNALMADIRSLRQEMAKGKSVRPSKVKRKKGGPRGGGQADGVPAAVRTRLAFVGMRDKGALCSSYTMGYVYVGNGTNGVNNAILFQTSNSSLIVGAQTAQPIIPVFPGDSVLGKTYISDESKHFSRRRYRRLLLHVDSLQPNTNSALVLVVAPVRGSKSCSNTTPTVLATSAATAATMDQVRSMKGNIYLNSFSEATKRTTLDLTPFIAGGTGPQQNEFSTASTAGGAGTTAFVAATTVSAAVGDTQGVSPCCIMVAGTNTISGNQGTQVFELIIEMEYDLLDFMGGTPIPCPIG